MNAAEITDKLGLHSLRQRAWVSYRLTSVTWIRGHANFYPVHPIYLCYLRWWSLWGSGMAEQLAPKGWSLL